MKRFLLSLSVCRKLADARRAKGMTQSALAQAVGCTQSAVSMFEGGQTEKIARETVEKMATLLDVALPEEEGAAGAAAGAVLLPQVRSVRGYCPQATCPSNVPYEVGGRIFLWPRLQSGTRCAYCGEVLETACPACGAPLREGACCSECGEMRVTPVLPVGTDVAAWAESRRGEIHSILELIGEKRQ